MPAIDWNICLPLCFGNPEACALTLSRAMADEPQRQALELFVQQQFRKAHNADIRQFMPELFGLSDGSGALCAVAGIRRASIDTLFLERYLDQPIEQQVHAAAGRSVERHGIVEVGNLAANSFGSARLSIITVTWLLAMGGLEWVAFTGNAGLVNSFNRLGLQPVTLCAADPARLGETRHTWGSYYDSRPNVHVGDIRAGFLHLSSMGIFERFGLPQTLEPHCHVA
ncbi:thermostable hemolysin [Pseudomonas syringae]|uniref:Thermostable hemolysin n=1 Tax=Pseudomonas viridiflava ICMP 13104 TaxID=1198305 RepID=A0A0W0H8E1_PSEVI|nr:thermostable hemolysin [Pseudomonas syringae]KTB57095.1 thermostable hemolysin [Pseudomonas viridiflava ICMP 13104]KTB86261.1 thermostable hemolysin [Pseudomonas syringae pv. syringae PD2766]MCF5468346.1 thermostable hemolysin [Pseudomonas syringae]MCF5472876.1 thermostable hemolysin [Pseudomonas syringae]MCF5482891.1 thermostable hemolysin [Pseudomonas syringae]